MAGVDVLIVTALPMERDAIAIAATSGTPGGAGVEKWQEVDKDNQPEYLRGDYVLPGGGSLTIALARPTRMGGIFASNVVSRLADRLDPHCLAMCGVCAGNPDDLVLGDVAIADTVFEYDAGKRTEHGFEGNLFPIPMNIGWVQRAKDLRPDGLPSYGDASEFDANLWLLERLYAGVDPVKHPARGRYFPSGTWRPRITQMEQNGLLRREKQKFVITDAGRDFVDLELAYSVDPPAKLPYAVVVGPMASGNAVVKDGVTWDMLKYMGQRSTIALEMEAASIGVASYSRSSFKWIVVKGVMDYADPKKDDRYKPFAARASAEVLLRFLERAADTIRDDSKPRRSAEFRPDEKQIEVRLKATENASKAMILRSLDEKLNGRELRPLFSYFSLITDFVKSELRAKDHNPNLWLSIPNHPDLRLWLVKQVDLMHVKDRKFFIKFVTLCRTLDTVADLWQNQVLNDNEVRAFIGSTLTVFGSLIPDALVRFALRDKDAWNFSERVIKLFSLMPANQAFLQIPCPTDKLTPADQNDERHLKFWNTTRKSLSSFG